MLRALADDPADPADSGSESRRILMRIKLDGYACTAVVPAPPLEPWGWTYTVGMCLYRKPDLVIAHMPAQQAITYLDHAVSLQRAGTTLKPGVPLAMPDGSTWKVDALDPKGTFCGLRWTMKLFGGTHVVRALQLMPPPPLQWAPGSSWAGHRCACGCEDRTGDTDDADDADDANSSDGS